MKYLLLSLALVFTCGLSAQPEHRVAINGRTVTFKEIDKLKIVGHEGKELKITRDGNERKEDDRTIGMRKISASGLEDNTGFGLSARGLDDRVLIQQIGRGDGVITVHVPNSAVVKVEQSTHRGGDLIVDNFNGELDVSMHYHKVKLNNAYGPLSINSIYGSIYATFSAGPPREDIRLHSTYQDVDITLPNNTAADVRLSTSYGSMYTDFDLTVEANKEREDRPKKEDGDDECCDHQHDDHNNGLRAKLNGGGKMLALTATYKNIYLRKLK